MLRRTKYRRRHDRVDRELRCRSDQITFSDSVVNKAWEGHRNKTWSYEVLQMAMYRVLYSVHVLLLEMLGHENNVRYCRQKYPDW